MSDTPDSSDYKTPKHTPIEFKSEKGSSSGKGSDFDPLNYPNQGKPK